MIKHLFQYKPIWIIVALIVVWFTFLTAPQAFSKSSDESASDKHAIRILNCTPLQPADHTNPIAYSYTLKGSNGYTYRIVISRASGRLIQLK